MKRTKFLSTLALATASIMCLAPVANAEEVVEKTKPSIESSSVTDELKKDTVENSQLILVESGETRNIEISDISKTIAELSDEYGFKAVNYKNSSGEVIDPEYKLVNGENLVLYKSELSAKSEVIELTIPTVEKETDDLFVGETKVESEGKTGEALKTTVTTKDLSADKSVNKETTQKESSSVNEKLTVLTAPEPKIVLIGTKEKPAPVVEDTEDISSESNVESTDIERDPISGEPLNNQSVESTSAPEELSPAGFSGYSNSNGINNMKASTKSLSEISSSDKARGEKAVELAYTRLGSDYDWGSSGENAFDCSGLTHWIYNQQLGVDIPRTAKQQGSSSQQIPLSALRPGDLLWTDSHIGLYIGNGQMIHASRSNDEVVVSGIGWFVDDGAKAARVK